MKKIIYLLSALTAFTFTVDAQNSVPNGNFETWTTGNAETPTGYFNSNPSTFFRCNTPFNCVKTTDAYHGSYAIQLTTNNGNGDTCMGYIVNAPNPNGNNPCMWQGGVPFNQVPTGIRGYYKSNLMAGDSGGIIIAFRAAGSCVGMYTLKFGGTHNAYTLFSIPFTPALTGTPDTMIFAAISSDVFNSVQKPGSMLQLDSISLVGVTQPANLNGDFENWTPQPLYKASGWYLQNTNDQGMGITRTADAAGGSYAVELSSWLGDNNMGTPLSRGGSISTGYYLNNCQGMNCQRGGYPFTNQIDTLCFYYKYTPASNDTAQVWLNFKKNGNMVGNAGMPMPGLVSNYTFKKVGFNIGTPIDSVIVNFQASSWRDTAVSYLGSVFKVDEVFFLSQATGIRTYDSNVSLQAYPNPSANGTFTVNNVDYYDLVRVMNVYGEEVPAKITKVNNTAQIQVSNPGAYLIYINARGKVTNLKVIAGKE